MFLEMFYTNALLIHTPDYKSESLTLKGAETFGHFFFNGYCVRTTRKISVHI